MLWAGGIALLVAGGAACWAVRQGLLGYGPVPWAIPAEERGLDPMRTRLAQSLRPSAGAFRPFESDIVYGHAGGVALKLDLARPTQGQGPFPAVVCLHGGGWYLGSKEVYDPVIRSLARHGYVAASVEYRLAPRWPFPAQIEDAKCAVRYLRSRARELNLDPNRIASLGESAGGHLALLLGLMGPGDGMEGDGGHPEQPSQAQAVVDFYGPTDLRQWQTPAILEPWIRSSYGRSSRAVMEGFLGTRDLSPAALARVSPLTYVSRGDPPVLTFHGTLDPLVPVEQSRALHQALRRAGVPETLVTIPGGLHGWGGRVAERTTALALAFLDKQLKDRRK